MRGATGTVTRVKVCGLTNLEDARAAAEAGADFLGFVFAPSPRRVDPARARGFWRSLPAGIPRVGVFRDQPLEEVEAVLAACDLDYLQFHGCERPAYCRVFGRRVIKAVSARTPADLRVAEAFLELAEIVLVDLPKDEAGVLSLEVARAAARLPVPVLLAGGLNPGNVGVLVREARPWGVDVARGVESSPGVKDHDAIRRFVLSAREGAAAPREAGR